MRDKDLDAITNGVVMVDFDGVITHRPSSLKTCGKMRMLSVQALDYIRRQGYEIVIYTARENLEPVLAFLKSNPRLNKIVSKVTNVKESADLYIDDRAYRFNGSWESSLFSVFRLLSYHKNPRRNSFVAFFSDVKNFLLGFVNEVKTSR